MIMGLKEPTAPLKSGSRLPFDSIKGPMTNAAFLHNILNIAYLITIDQNKLMHRGIILMSSGIQAIKRGTKLPTHHKLNMIDVPWKLRFNANKESYP